MKIIKIISARDVTRSVAQLNAERCNLRKKTLRDVI
jgi:hypothetical protein